MTDFDMPPVSAGYPERGRWLIDRLMVDLDLTDNQAAGIVGNISFESGGLTKLHEIGQPEGRGGYGWAQWTAARREAFLAFAAKHLLYWRSDEANYGYLLLELLSDYHHTIDALKSITTVNDAVFSVGQTYERPGGTTPDHLPGFNDRLTYAMRALAGSRGVQSVVATESGSSVLPIPILAPADPAYLELVYALELPEIKLIQKALSVKQDAIVGPITLAALEKNRSGT